MRLTALQTIAIGSLGLSAAACSRPATVPSDPIVSHVGTVDQLVGSLRGQGKSVSVGDETSPQRLALSKREMPTA